MRKISIIITLILFLVFTVRLNALMAGNESCIAFNPGTNSDPCDIGIRSKGPTLGLLIVEGGGYFLESTGEIHKFLSLVESSEITSIDFKALRENLNAAVYNMEKTIETYYQLKSLADVTPYNQDIINRLIEFNYESFQNEKGLIPVIFEKVEKFLVFGDVRGIYGEFYIQTGKILEMLNDIKKDVDAGNFPKISSLWRINQKYSEFKLFAQYVAEVFYSIK